MRKEFSLLFASLMFLFVQCAEKDVDQKIQNKSSEIIESIFNARETKDTIAPVSVTFGEFPIKTAYDIQDKLTSRLSKKLGAVSGYKIGFATPSAFEKYNISEPACGALFEKQKIDVGGTIHSNEFVLFHIETEVAFTLDKTIDRKVNSKDEIRPYIRAIHVGFDIADTCWDLEKGSQTIPDFIVNGAGSHNYVIGPPINPDDVALDNLTLKLFHDDMKVYEGSSKNVMGNPWNVLIWLANHQIEREKPLQEGYVILTGKVAPAYKKSVKDAKGKYVGDGGSLGTITVFVE